MIGNERITAFLASLESGNGEICDTIAKQAQIEGVPIIKPETASFLKTLVELKQPKSILEIGCATGYSALLMCQVMPKDSHITTIEKYKKRIPIAKLNFEKAKEAKRITLLEGDAEDILPALSDPYDFIFMDAAKGQYLHWLPMIMRVLMIGGVLVTDNVLQDGDIVESRFAVERRNRTIHGRMRDYLYTLKHMEQLETSIVPIGDGIAMSVHKKGTT